VGGDGSALCRGLGNGGWVGGGKILNDMWAPRIRRGIKKKLIINKGCMRVQLELEGKYKPQM
jgi:hypothetical protein